MSISSRLAGLAHQVASAPNAAPVALESMPRVIEPSVHTVIVRPFSPPVALDWRIATSPSADNPTVPSIPLSAAPRRRIVTWNEVERDVRAAYAVAQGEPILGDEAGLSADREPLPVKPETSTADPSATVDAGAHDAAPGDDSPPPIEVGRQRRRPLSGRERMARRRAELRRLGLPGETKGRLKALKVTVTSAPTAEIVTAGAGIVTTAGMPTAEIVTATAGLPPGTPVVSQRKLARGVFVRSCDANSALEGWTLANTRPQAEGRQWL